MTGDRYLRTVLTVIAIALCALAANSWMTTFELSRAEAQSPKYEHSIPKAWGKVIGIAGSGDLLLEDAEGVLRQVEIQGKSPEYPRVKVLLKRS
jgi:hypothetical protein